VLVVTAIGSAAAGSAAAQADQPAAQIDQSLNPSPKESESVPLTFSVTPYIGYRFGGTFTLADTDTHVDVDGHGAFALALDLSTDHLASQYELFYSRQSTSLGSQSPVPSRLVVEYLQFGGTTEFLESNPSPYVRPYLIGSLGATRMSPNSALGSDRTYFSASLGMGVRTPVNQHLSFRFEARGYLTVLSASTAVFCSSNQNGGLCAIQARGSSFLQADILAGVSYAF